MNTTRIIRSSNYRTFYEVRLDVVLTPKYDIHHLDFDRTNNDLSNLVAIPRQLHQDFHSALGNIWPINTSDTESLMPLSCIDKGNKYFIQAVNNLHLYTCYLAEVQKWLDYRNHLMGLLPNIHDLSYD